MIISTKNKRGDQLFAVDFNKKLTAFKFGVNRKIFGCKFYYAMIFGINLILLVAVDKHHDAGIHQERAETGTISNGTG